MPPLKREGVGVLGKSKKSKLEDGNKKLNKSSFARIKFNTIFQKTINETSGKQRLKMVIIENCPTIQEAEVIPLSDYIKSLAESEVFIVILSLLEPMPANEAEFLQQISDKVFDKPMLLQFNYKEESSIFYKEANEGFRRLILKKENIFDESSVMNAINFEILCNLLHFGSSYGKFNFNLIETEIAMEKCICGYRLIDWAVKQNNLLCLMFLQLFNPVLESCNEHQTRLLEVAAESGSLRCFEILLNSQNNRRTEPSEILKLSLISKNHENLLMIAVRNKKFEIASFLIKRGLNTNLLNATGMSMSDVAWDNYITPSGTKSSKKNLDIIIELLYNDAPFPRNFDINQINSKLHLLRFGMFIRERKNFHDSIRNNRIEDVTSFIENKNLKFVYDEINKCALTTAIESKKFEIYSFLRSKGFSSGIDFNFDFYLQALDENEKESLRISNLKYFHCNINQHVMDLVSKSQLAFENGQNNFGKILKLFETLDAIPEIRPILKIVASSDKIVIVFDFRSDSVGEMDPTSDKLHVKGRTYSESGHILIGARREDDNILLGTLAHELTHYAMQLVYNNNCLPFKWEDESTESEFQAIVETYENQSIRTKNEIIERAFQKNYNMEQKMAELIVRAPHLLAMHSNEPEALAKIYEEFYFLFNFFKQTTLPDLEREANFIKEKRELKEANNHFGVFAKAVQSNWLSDAFSPSIDISKSIFVKSSVPDLVLECLVKCLQFEGGNEINSRHIFVSLEQMFIKENFEMLKSAAESKVLEKIFVIEDSETFSTEVVGDEWKNLFNQCVIVIVSKNQKSVFSDFFQSKTDFDLHFSDLNEKAKSRILKSKVTFQDHEVILDKIVENELLLQDLPLELILEPCKLKLQSSAKSLPSPPRVFIERRFQRNVSETLEEIKLDILCDILHNQETVIISDLAGMGKSTSAVQIARELKLKNPLFWVVFIDLKQHTKAFLRDNQPQTVKLEANYFSQKVLKLESSFEQKLFKSFYENKKLVFIIDGFDEISPNYKQFVMKILKANKKSGNMLLVTTRPHLVEDLQKQLEARAFNLVPFSGNEQIKFLTKYWEHTNNINESKIEELLRNFRLSWYNDFYSTPIHIFMLAEVFDDRDLNNLDHIEINILSLYKRFFTMKLDIWNTKMPLALSENNEIQQSSLNLQQIFHKLALEQLFNAEELEELKLPEIPEDITDEMIARVGIVTFDVDGTIQFTHRTFAEYFTADFILKGITGKNPQKSVFELFFKSLMSKNFEIVRKLMNEGFGDKLNAQNLMKTFEALENKMFYIDEDRKKRPMLYNVVREKHTNIMSFVLETLNFDTNVKAKHVKSFLFEAVENKEMSEIIWRCVENFKRDVQKDILFAKKGDGNILGEIIRFGNRNGGNNTLQQFLDIAIKLSKEEDFLKLFLGEEYLHFRFYENASIYKGVLGVIWEAAKQNLGTENLKKLATGSDKWTGETIPLSFQWRSDELLLWLDDVKNLLTANELTELLTAKNKCNRVMFTITVDDIPFEEFKMLWKFIEDNVDEAGQRKLIFHEKDDEEQKILFELSIANKDKQVSDFIFEITESLLQKEGEDVVAYFRERNQLVDSFLTQPFGRLRFLREFRRN